MTFEQKLDKIASLLGGRTQMAQALNVGNSAISNYAKRGQIPATKRALLKSALLAHGHQLDTATLTVAAAAPPAADRPICLLIITGGIAAYKSLELARRLMDVGYQVRGVMTQSAQQFITPLSLSALTAQKVYTDLFSLTDEQEMGHIRLAREADLVLIAPATGNFLAKIALGLADDLASTLCLASEAPLYFVPAMNPVMWDQPATRQNCATLISRGARQIGPDEGDTACGEIGRGRMAAVPDIIAALSHHHQDELASPLSGRRILITAGPTREPIDGVRYITNHSSGKQGYAIAKAARDHGAEVVLISGPTALAPPEGVTFHQIETAAQLYQASHQQLSHAAFDVAICTAAVADWHVVGASHRKLKKTASASPPLLELGENPDILATICQSPHRPALVIGFAAETDNVIAAAIAKRHKKGCDWIMANHIAPPEGPGTQATGNVFGADDNELTLVREGEETTWPKASKQDLAARLLHEIAKSLSS